MKTGLVLEGGAMRGLFSAGVMDVMMEAQLRFDAIVGVSAGAAFGCNYKSGQIGRAIRYNLRFCRDPRYCGLRSLLLTGNLFGAEFCYHTLPAELDPFDGSAFENDPAEFYLVCTDTATGKAVYHQCLRADDECFEWMRASGSMPLVSRPVRIGGKTYLDGAIADSIPLRFAEERLGYAKNVVILTQPPGFRKQAPKHLPLLRFMLRKYPAVLRALETRHEVYNETVRHVEEQAAAGRVLLIRPGSPLPVGRISHDPKLLRETYDIGREHGRKQISALRAFLSER